MRPEDVDVVVNTHVHADHVGWNTVEREGEWVPAFPNARYLIAAADYASVDPQSDHSLGRPDDHLVFADSIAPVRHAGQAVLWEESHRIDAHLTLEPAPGPPGSSVLRLASGTDRAVFVGDVLHSPVQILDPSCNSCSARTNGLRRRPAAASWNVRRTSANWSSRHTLRAPGRRGSGARAPGSRSRAGRRANRSGRPRG
ncbi:MBL fold metallo-hydrolase [Streptomyces sp. NBC_00390]|uniref:MBL fold metallo-hydrolase n=1 Tax=Streptomyces sp. NBC_00390 TaxID=2975736 RepID=UPI002E1C3586